MKLEDSKLETLEFSKIEKFDVLRRHPSLETLSTPGQRARSEFTFNPVAEVSNLEFTSPGGQQI